ncbi:hypothetical protein BDN72DRAFT_273800 [Pluteus cervinus]|uniref:Uncharacterized protein n=1 Tax=Pluteus cervinus TaxID=181527 RepID=A0ACD3AFH1_9AGAR|nr:hypothetical protein BDN72DRAFT_273800 [Pluteus cervinus]
MKFFQVFVTLAVLGVSTSGVLALTDAEITEARAARSGSNMEKQSCNYDTPCKGYGWAPGLHCGDGYFGCVKGHVFQIGSDTNVCDYGTRNSCVQCNQLTC